MADKKGTPKMIYESQSSLYEKAVKTMNADRLIVQYAFKIENYQDAAEMFEQLNGYRDADELAKRCRQLAEETRKEEVEYRYRVAIEQKEQAQDAKEFGKAKKLLEQVAGYKDADRLIEECVKQRAYYEKKAKIKRIGKLCIVLLCAAAIAGFFLSPTWETMKQEIIAANTPSTEAVAEEVETEAEEVSEAAE